MLKRTTSDDLDFQNLVQLLDKDLAIRDGDDHPFYAQFNKIDSIKNVFVYYRQDLAVGCGAFKQYDSTTVEIKECMCCPSFANRELPLLF